MFALLTEKGKVIGLFITKPEVESAIVALHRFFDDEYLIREVADLAALKKVMEEETDYCCEKDHLTC